MKQISLFVYCLFVILACKPKLEKENSKNTTSTYQDIVSTGLEDRAYSISLLQRLTDSVLIPLSENRLHKAIPRRDWETRESNIHTSPLQAFGRSLSGMAPWLSLGVDETEEGQLREQYINLAVQGLINATNPSSPDFMFKKHTKERIVHAAYLAYPLIIASEQLWEPLTEEQQNRVINALKTHRNFIPNESNWLLFPAIIEAAIWKLTGECEIERITYAIEKHKEWYLGDGVYGDGPNFHWDYYNSYVIHPLLLTVLEVSKEMKHPSSLFLPEAIKRAKRYALITEHLVSPEGTYPAIGRSSVYRFAYFQLLGYVTLKYGLPEPLEPGATRTAITTVIKKMAEMPGTFNEDGWLNAGIVGQQINARDRYNYTGALYMCTMGLTHLGIPKESAFWTEPAGDWTQRKIWLGKDLPNQKIFK